VQNPRQPTAAIVLNTPTESFIQHEEEQYRRAGETRAALEKIRVEILGLQPTARPLEPSDGRGITPSPGSGGGVVVPPRGPG